MRQFIKKYMQFTPHFFLNNEENQPFTDFKRATICHWLKNHNQLKELEKIKDEKEFDVYCNQILEQLTSMINQNN